MPAWELLLILLPEAALILPDFQEGCSLFFDDFVPIFRLLFLEDSDLFQFFLCVFGFFFLPNTREVCLFL